MKLRLTLERPARESVDLNVTCDATATIKDLAEFLYVADPGREKDDVVPPGLTLSTDASTSGAMDPTLTVPASGLRSGQRVGLVQAGNRFAARQERAAGLVRVVAGPDEGHEFPLKLGVNTVGRAADCEVKLHDDMISRRHLRITVGDITEVADLGSSNGVSINGVPAVRQQVGPGDRIKLGETIFQVRLLHVGTTEGRVEGNAVPFIKSPRLVKIFGGEKFDAPEIPEHQPPMDFPYTMLMVPILMAVVMYSITRSFTSVIYMAMMPLMVVGIWVENRLSQRRQWKRSVAQFRQDTQILVHDIQQSLHEEQLSRLVEHPSVSECSQAVHDLSPLLWTRRADSPGFTEYRVGLGTQPSRNEIRFPTAARGPRDLYRELVDAIRPYQVVHDVPITLHPAEAGGVGVAGTRSLAAAMARSIVSQAAVLHSPENLTLAVIASAKTADDWAWMKWLPHVEGNKSPLEAPHLTASEGPANQLLSELEELVADRAKSASNEKNKGPTLPVVLVVVESDTPVEFGRLVSLAEQGWAHGVHVLWVAPDVTQLPSACRTFVDVTTAPHAEVGYVRTGDLAAPVAMEVITLDDATVLARRMAPVEDLATRSDDASDLPRSIGYASLVGEGLLGEPNFVIERWVENRSVMSGPYAPSPLPRKAAKLRGVLGVNSAGLHSLDMRVDGPHALVGGTTGSGKSELLQTWILGMAATNSPQRLNFLLVDYKGGSAFAECNDLPHTVGLVTDLNKNGVRRALTSLSAELTYREHVLNRFSAKDLVTLEKSHPAEAPPSLIIIVDEFAALVQEVPDFVDGVVNVAQRGRSLGLHLILATQRPAGVIKGNLLANTNLRLALRVADIEDSNDVLGIPNAAHFSAETPGRAISKTGPGRYITFQTGYVGGHTGVIEVKADIRVVELGFQQVRWEAPVVADQDLNQDPGPNDIARIVTNIQNAFGQTQIPIPRKPWLPELKSFYPITSLPTKRRDDELVFAVADDAETQSQPAVAFRPDAAGNMAIIGTGGSGKSTMLRTFAVAAGFTVRGGPCQVYCLDFGSRGLAMLEDLPHVGAVVVGSDEERVERLVTFLKDTVEERAARYAAVNAATINEYRRVANKPDEPRIFVLVDNVGAFRNSYESMALGVVWDNFVSVAGDGRPVGVHLILTADRLGAMPTPLLSAIQNRVVLRMSDADEYSNVGVPKDILDADSVPGRGIFDELEIQVAVLGESADPQDQARAMKAFGQSMQRAGLKPAPPIRSLPEAIPPSELPATVEGRPVLGMRSVDLAPWPFDPVGSFIITGPPGSGRTTAMRSVLRALKRQDPSWQTVLFTTKRSGIGQLERFTHVARGADNIEELARELTDQLRTLENSGGRFPKLAVFMEAVDELAASSAETDLAELVGVLLANDLFVVSEGEVNNLSGGYGLVGDLKSSRRGLSLQPDSSDGQSVFRTDFPMRLRSASFPPGRGLLVALGKTSLGQVMLPEE